MSVAIEALCVLLAKLGKQFPIRVCIHSMNLAGYQSKSRDLLTTVNREYLVKHYSSYVIDQFMRLLAKG